MHKNTLERAALMSLGLLLVAASTQAQSPSVPEVLDMREGDQSWVNDPHVHEFYQLTVATFAGGTSHVDRATYEKRSFEIFRRLAVARHLSPDAFAKHAAAIPSQMIKIVTRDPQTLASYDRFVVALFGPQSSSAKP